MSFAGKAIIVTGASAGIGRELAIALAARGARLALAARRRPELEETAAACRGEAVILPTDLARPDACRALVDGAVAALGGIDAVVHDAGITMHARFDEVRDLSLYETLMRVNYLGPVHVTHRALPHLRARRGLVVAVSSLLGLTGAPTRTGYAASKHALQGFMDSLRLEVAADGIDVLVVSPGFVATGIRARAGHAAVEPRRAMTAAACAARIVDAMARRRREVLIPGSARALQALRLIAPGVVDRFIARAFAGRRP